MTPSSATVYQNPNYQSSPAPAPAQPKPVALEDAIRATETLLAYLSEQHRSSLKNGYVNPKVIAK